MQYIFWFLAQHKKICHTFNYMKVVFDGAPGIL
jgi:hypothetical protein